MRASSLRPRKTVGVLAGLLLISSIPQPLGSGEGQAPARREVLVFAAASLSGSLQEAVGEFRKDHPAAEVAFNFGASGDLARQIASGAPADLYIAADTARAEALVRAGRVDPGDVRPILSNLLAVVVPRGSPLALRSAADLAGPEVRRIALADPATAPAGAYARAWLEGRGLWEKVREKVLPALDVRSALAAVATRAADCGIVYRTDAVIEKGAETAFEVPAGEGPSIAYSLAVIRGAPRSARELAAFLAGPRALEVFRRSGFLPPPHELPPPPPAPLPPRPGEWALLWFTVRIALASTALILVPGILLALALARGRWRGKSVVETLVSLPLVLPPTAVGLLLLDLLSRKTAFGAWLHDALGLEVAFTPRAVALATAVMSFPLLVRSARTAFEEVPRRLEEIARTLGRGRLHVFLTITLPLAHRGVLAGVVLAFSRALGEFGATIVVAGNIPGRTQTLALAIFHRVQVGDDPGAYRLVAITAAIAFAAIWTAGMLSRGGRKV